MELYDDSTILGSRCPNTSTLDKFAILAPNVGPTREISILDNFAIGLGFELELGLGVGLDASKLLIADCR